MIPPHPSDATGLSWAPGPTVLATLTAGGPQVLISESLNFCQSNMWLFYSSPRLSHPPCFRIRPSWPRPKARLRGDHVGPAPATQQQPFLSSLWTVLGGAEGQGVLTTQPDLCSRGSGRSHPLAQTRTSPGQPSCSRPCRAGSRIIGVCTQCLEAGAPSRVSRRR